MAIIKKRPEPDRKIAYVILIQGDFLVPGATNPARTPFPANAAPAAVSGPVLIPVTVDHEQNNPLRMFSLSLMLALVFLRVSAFHQVQTVLMGVNLRLLYVVGIPAILGTFLCGGLQRSFRKSPAYYWTGYFIWMALACPTSTWTGESVTKTVIPYLRTNLIMLFLVAGLIIGWNECRSLLRCFAWSAVGSLLVARLFQRSADRFALEFGTVSNANDFAAHLLFCLPFLYWVVLTSKSMALRLICLGGIAYGVLIILQTGSRGGLLGLLAVVLALMCWGSTMQRLALLIIIPIGCIGVVAALPHQTLNRILSFSWEDKDASAEALQSSDQRRYLLQKSVEYAFQHPIFGIGPGEFPNYEGKHNQVIGTHGTFHETHNSFTEAASECGIPAFLLMVAGLAASFRIFYSIFRKARRRNDSRDIQDAMMCTMLCMVGFVVAITFLNFAYFFYQPLLGGWAIAAYFGTKEEFEKRDLAAQVLAIQPSPVAQRNPWIRPTPGLA